MDARRRRGVGEKKSSSRVKAVVLSQAPAGMPDLETTERCVRFTVASGLEPGALLRLRVEDVPFQVRVPPRRLWSSRNAFYAKVNLAEAHPDPESPTAPLGDPPADDDEASFESMGQCSYYTQGSRTSVCRRDDALLGELPAAVPSRDSNDLEYVPVQTVVHTDLELEEDPGIYCPDSWQTQKVLRSGNLDAVGERSGSSSQDALYSRANPFVADIWLPQQYLETFQERFEAAGPMNGLLTPDSAREVLLGTNVPPEILADVWELADDDNNGVLDLEEFSLAMFLCIQVHSGVPLPDRTQPLPQNLIPPSKRVRAE